VEQGIHPTDRYAYKYDHIHVLYGDGEDWRDPKENGRYIVNEEPYDYGDIEQITDYPAYYQDVENIFTWLRDGNQAQNIQAMTSDGAS
jgi:hypothetical protein